MYPIGVWYSSQHRAPHVAWTLRQSARNRSILGGYFQKILHTCNQRLAAPSGETFLGGTHKALGTGVAIPGKAYCGSTNPTEATAMNTRTAIYAVSASANGAKTPKTNCTSSADLQRNRGGSSSVSLWTTRAGQPMTADNSRRCFRPPAGGNSMSCFSGRWTDFPARECLRRSPT